MKNIYEKLKEKVKNYKEKEILVLFIIGIICLVQIAICILMDANDIDGISIVIRSQLVGIFGYLFSVKIRSTQSYKAREIQFHIATIVAIVSLFILIFAYWFRVKEPVRSLGSIRDLLVSSVCFIIGMSKDS